MSSQSTPAQLPLVALETLRRNWVWFLILGLLLVVLILYGWWLVLAALTVRRLPKVTA